MFIEEIFNEIAVLYVEMAPYILLGLVFAGILKVFFKSEFITKHVGKDNLSSVSKASLFGIPLPLCSCSVLPTALSLRKSGASQSATTSFLVSTPQTGIDSIIATYGMMGWIFGVFRPLIALIMGIITGILVLFGVKKNKTDESSSGEEECINGCEIARAKSTNPSLINRMKNFYFHSFVEFIDDISVQLIIGLILAGIIAYVVPSNLLTNVGSGLSGMMLMLVAGIPMYICATASIPIAVTLMMKGVSPGAAFVFLAVGPVTNMASITVIFSILGKRNTIIYLVSVAVLSVLAGLLLDFIFQSFNLDPLAYLSGMKEHVTDNVFYFIVSMVFLVFLIFSMYRKIKNSKIYTKIFTNKGGEPDMTFTVNDISCNSCAMTIKNAIMNIGNVDSVDVDVKNKTVSVEGKVDEEIVKKAIINAGYTI